MSEPACSPLHAAHYADKACYASVPIRENERVADKTWRLRFEAPEIAQQIVPGQFVMLRLAGLDDPLLGRAFALYDVVGDSSGEPIGIDIVYLVHGKLTTRLAACQPGDELEVWGPLGNGFSGAQDPPSTIDELILVAGGIGQTPFLAVGKEALGHETYGTRRAKPLRAKRVTLCYGVRHKDLVAGQADFEGAAIDVRLASDDGSVGHAGLVTDLLATKLDETRGQSRKVLCCGPEPMMQAVAELCLAREVACEVSLETPMACGLGICFSCVAKVVQPDGSWDYKRTCVEGPIFDAAKLVW